MENYRISSHSCSLLFAPDRSRYLLNIQVIHNITVIVSMQTFSLKYLQIFLLFSVESAALLVAWGPRE